MVELHEETKVNKKEEVSLDGELFLDEFKDVFSDEVTKLPLVRKFDHAMDLVANAILVSRASYLISLAHNEKLESNIVTNFEV